MAMGTLLIRASKVVLTAGLALFAFLVTWGNIVDYESNWLFVQHVLAMDTVFPQSSLRARAITDPAVQALAYHGIIVVEGLTCVAFAVAAGWMAATLKAPKAAFARAKAVTALGVLLGFGLWFVGFMVVGGEWFAMWQSQVWNGQTTAFQFTLVILAVGVFVFLDND